MGKLFARCLLALALLTAPAAAAAGPAADLIEDMADRAIKVLAETEGDLAAREAKLREVLKQDFDMPLIARFAMGRYWRRASQDQRHSYTAAFSDYVVATYARRFGGYAGEKLEISSEREAGPNDVLVATEIVRDGGGPPIVAEWRVRVGDPSRVIDVIVEGVSMSVTQRAEFAAVIRKNGIDGLIQVLQARAGRRGAQP